MLVGTQRHRKEGRQNGAATLTFKRSSHHAPWWHPSTKKSALRQPYSQSPGLGSSHDVLRQVKGKTGTSIRTMKYECGKATEKTWRNLKYISLSGKNSQSVGFRISGRSGKGLTMETVKRSAVAKNWVGRGEMNRWDSGQ